MPALGLGGDVVPYPGAPLPVENSGTVLDPKSRCMRSASIDAASKPSLSTSDDP